MSLPELILTDLSDYLGEHIRSYLQGFIAFQIIPEDQQLLESLLNKDEVDEATAYAFVLVDLANSDGAFDPRERKIIEGVLTEIFPERKKDAITLIKTAENLINNFMGANSFTASIKQIYSAEERDRFYSIIDKVISSDDTVTPDENFFRNKYRVALK